jgi:uncharacterized membrane protein YwaF
MYPFMRKALAVHLLKIFCLLLLRHEVEIIEWRVTLQEQPITLLLPFELAPGRRPAEAQQKTAETHHSSAAI